MIEASVNKNIACSTKILYKTTWTGKFRKTARKRSTMVHFLNEIAGCYTELILYCHCFTVNFEKKSRHVKTVKILMHILFQLKPQRISIH